MDDFHIPHTTNCSTDEQKLSKGFSSLDRIKMALTYIVSLLLVLQVATAVPLNSTDEDEMISTEVFLFVNDTTEPENGTDVTLTPLTNVTADNETLVDTVENTEENFSTDETTSEETVETMSYISETEPTTTNLPPTKEPAKIENMAALALPSSLAILLPVCVRLVTVWSRCL
ncbi:uncharacterized protein CEXT_514301 [Caerostris extrusa]|uniref:Uncharacterized protein n=1 Tax=Caerostris extrusa TaxID=172846 RepID=A0AAV4XE73_CAEEX|nr:uncharacterized protein CEXT_514301 [Caerostris extrusa]